ncbi:MAG: hypothetical protein HLUCCO07_16780 [Rhodobacteraceae bacterium HLUCCO07]|nr:MAG: hypothetical protein HLUCCO07_16780 [Rhodobacteraceae bacterium HLUCCO07]
MWGNMIPRDADGSRQPPRPPIDGQTFARRGEVATPETGALLQCAPQTKDTK